MSQASPHESAAPAQPSRLWMGVGFGVVIVIFLGLLGYGVMTREPQTAASGSARTGKPAPDFTLATFDGREVRLADLRGQGVVVNFWASWCPPCRAEMPALNEAHERFKDQGVVFIGVNLWNISESEAEARRFAEAFDIQYYIGREPETAPISLDYGVSGLPSTFFIDAEGTVVQRWVGELDLNRLDQLVMQIVPTT